MHSGNYAVNTTTFNSYGNAYVYRDMYLPVKNNLFTDFWWKLDHITNTAADYSIIYFELNYSYYIYYVLGRSSSSTFSNSTSSTYYFVDNCNVTGTWNNLIRDVATDCYDAFGNSDWIITETRLQSVCYNSGGKVTTLFDDIYFVRDTTPPDISSVTIQETPVYYEETVVEITANDLLHPITEVVLSYQNDSIWYPILATQIDENTYTAVIPQFDYGTAIEFYVEAFDTLGYNNTDNNSGSYYSFTVADDIDPELLIFGPAENETLVGQIVFYIESLDIGSDIKEMSIVIDETSLYNGTAIDLYTLDTTLYADGVHTISVSVEDYAGNSIEVERELTIDNPAPVLVVLGNLFNWGTLVGAGLVGLGIGIFFLVRFIKLRKAA